MPKTTKTAGRAAALARGDWGGAAPIAVPGRGRPPKPEEEKGIKLAVYLRPDLWEWLQDRRTKETMTRHGGKRQVTLSELVNEALEEYRRKAD